MLLVQGSIPFHHGIGATRRAEINEVVIAGVRAYLHGYAYSSSRRNLAADE